MEDLELREKAHIVCSNYVGGAWKNISPNDIVMEIITGGFFNCVCQKVVKLSLPENINTEAGEPRHLIMKDALNKSADDKFGIMTENVIVCLLAEKKIAPKVYGVYDGGRLDDIVPSRLLKPHELHNPDILDSIARSLAQIHVIRPPVRKCFDEEFDNCYVHSLKRVLKDPRNEIREDQQRQLLFKKFMRLNPWEDLKWLFKKRETINSPILFSHGNLFLNNILLCDDPSNGLIQIVNYEMAAYNYRGYDFGSFFLSFCFDYTHPNPPYIKMNLKDFPSLEEQQRFIRIYLKEFQKEAGDCNLDHSSDLEEEEKHLLEEFKVFTLLWYFSMMMFGMENSEKCKGKIEALSYAELMMEAYITQKKEFFPGI